MVTSREKCAQLASISDIQRQISSARFKKALLGTNTLSQRQEVTSSYKYTTNLIIPLLLNNFSKYLEISPNAEPASVKKLLPATNILGQCQEVTSGDKISRPAPRNYNPHPKKSDIKLNIFSASVKKLPVGSGTSRNKYPHLATICNSCCVY